VIYGKEYCYSCYFGFGKKHRMNAWVRRKRSSHCSKIFCSSSQNIRKILQILFNFIKLHYNLCQDDDFHAFLFRIRIKLFCFQHSLQMIP
jgi:hypothetical protein